MRDRTTRLLDAAMRQTREAQHSDVTRVASGNFNRSEGTRPTIPTKGASYAQPTVVMFQIGPPLMGFLAESWGIRGSSVVRLLLILPGLITSGVLGSE